MKTARQEYVDASFEEALKTGCNTAQLKYDGWWSRTEVINGEGKVYSETGRHLPKFDFQLLEPHTLTVIGELMHGTQWSRDPGRQGKVFLFDLWQYEEIDTESLPYKSRFEALKTARVYLPSNYDLIQNFPIHARNELWTQFVETQQFEGLVYRKSSAAAGLPILREKYLFTEDLQVRGFREGLGKHQGRLGALLCIDNSGVVTDVGGGFDDKTREEVWKNQDAFLNRWCQVEARKRFDSGSLRHPNFVAWRPEGWAP